MNAMATKIDAADILTAARALAPQIREGAAEHARNRRLSSALVQHLADAGVFRIAVPRERGGAELNPLQQLRLVEELSHADASVGWCTMILSDSGFIASHLKDDVARTLYADLDTKTAGVLTPSGVAELAPGGFRVSGRWSMASGCHHAELIALGCFVRKDGQMIMTEQGFPRMRIVLVPKEAVAIIDTWNTLGLAASGSDDVEVRDVFIPEEHSFSLAEPGSRKEPLYAYKGFVASNIAGVPLGLARRAIEETVQIIQSKGSMLGSQQRVCDEQRALIALAEAEAELGSARAFAESVLIELWNTVRAEKVPSFRQRASLGMMMVRSAQSATRVVEAMCELAGSSVIFTRSPLERLRRDMLTINTHFALQRKTYELSAKMLLGSPSPFSPF